MQVRVFLLGLTALLALAVGGAQDPGLMMEQRYGLNPDFAANMRVEIIGQRVALAAGMPHIQYAIINQQDLNAFALPDGRVYITSRMAHDVSDDELAFVLGHEVTHIKEGHAKRQQQRATGGALLGAVLVAVFGGGMNDVRLGADIAGGLTFGHYSRKDERKADAGGLQWMTRAGYDPHQAAAAMQRLIDKYGAGDAKIPILGWFATHPNTNDRRNDLQKDAEKILKAPPAQVAAPLGIQFTLDPRSADAAGWAHNYFSLAMAAYGNGKALVIPVLDPVPAPATVIPVAAAPIAALALGNQANDPQKEKDDKDTPLPAVTVNAPDALPGYTVTLLFEQIPPMRLAALEPAQGTAVRATLCWTELKGGFSGVIVATVQTAGNMPWKATEQLTDPAALNMLSDGKALHIEGTLEGAAVRRIARAFAEIVKAGGPVNHSAPVTLKLPDEKARLGDYVGVFRDGKLVSEVAIDQLKSKDVTGTVLWGTHIWKKGDKFVVMEM